ncbi:DUF4345 family protein [Pseudohaliea rubra]|uniref:DUF4345 domain-containing protein n=1 Tax=Pseudohaliea rubra DSM 19751 TaxID=1265313 RepID=A0A095VUW4_9GAMM|nr:DUF4345 family protein [Pseudohaliea rubra]KGE05115.1 hypothetical protein HRUBRA_00317 [Pseudohaliea rubra DSM 19751]
MGKILLYIAGLIFTGYGLACLVYPAIAINAAGLATTTADGMVEIGAMYGGFQTGFGLFCLLCARRADYTVAGLWALLLGIGLLAAGRSYHALQATDPLTVYSYGAIAFESLLTVLAAVALLRRGGS